MSNFEQEAYHDKVNSKFAELMYQKMATKRYGVKFCCQEDNEKWKLQKELLDLNGLKSCTEDLVESGEISVCEQITISTTNGGMFTYTPCGSELEVAVSIPVRVSHTEVICYDIRQPRTAAEDTLFDLTTPVPCNL